MERPGASWISAHFFYHGDLGALLVECVQPLLARLEEKALIDAYFFVRYWQGGPHLRLRLLPRAAEDAAQIRDEVRRAATQYFQHHPAPDSLDAARYQELSGYLSYIEYGYDQRGPLYPNNSLHFLPYVPEYEHYGGQQAMPYIEKHFWESSTIALAFLTRSADRKQRTAHCLATMLLSAALADPDRAATARVIEQFSSSWERMPASLRTQLLASFDQGYERQRQHLSQMCELLLRLSSQPEPDLEHAGPATAVASWQRSIRQLYRRLSALEQAGLLYSQQLSPEPPATLRRARPISLSLPLTILLRCAHMHNNRLGLSIVEEAYVLHLLKRALEEGGETRNQLPAAEEGRPL
ncbi:thiopeptide-type bacteriocin biosynthesis protein [Thermogemmatispora sp.]|uniref:thiopeptide-type bacteriocin biosynthesis protein n=1 Tax=Thermogemmatispora sp. TaxID=1968838 RepID=UPI0035E422CC